MHGLGFDHSCLCPMTPMIPMTPRIHPDTRASRHPLHQWISVLPRCFLVSHMPFFTWRYILSVPRYMSQRRQTLGLQPESGHSCTTMHCPMMPERSHKCSCPTVSRTSAMERFYPIFEGSPWSFWSRRRAEQGVSCCIALSQCCLEKTQARRSSNTEYTLS
ncbi:hypothetical protein M430DRAFT_198039 [Amorphotheca resinae ATCC 22711]|jgi:hypothetical protein|uniref:Uncharacterized protein n=1 Tax=Amorphotheca resinae ATCC 22711 TaxID=857342 RepID=A0A2T3B9X4_AMORE|nr:hypothetical protein M430DRAFT_198039 [Amorphotheca resinae ATCC 22711]PSS25074.1 hypothetical protein M430DRAFT_198039 [Amorphotheca resinae ATCC 22711]